MLSIIYLYIKENNLFVCLLACHIEISQTTMPPTMLLASLKALNVYRCIEGVFLMFRSMMQELLKIELFCHLKVQ